VEVDVILTRYGDEWLIEIDGNRLPGATSEDQVHRVVDCYLWGRRVRDMVDNGNI
jgi:hypothetical protein